jgi:hypothetical protein
LGKLLAADATTLAPAALNNKVALIQSAFSPNENMAITDPSLVQATFATSTALQAGVGTQTEGIDPISGDDVITLLSPAGGWLWKVTATTALPQTIYGAILMNNAGTLLLAAVRLATPVGLTAVGQQVDLGVLEVRIINAPFSSL